MLPFLFKNNRFRDVFSQIRFSYFSKKGLKYDVSSNILESEYSKNAFSKYQSIPPRIDYLISIVRTLNPKKNTELLSVGPRFESELFGYMGLGINHKNIKAVDTFSYSPLILVGDGHALQFRDSSFDIVVVGWTLPYSKNPNLFVSEMVRVCKKKGSIIIAFDLQKDVEAYIKEFTTRRYPFIPLVNNDVFILNTLPNNSIVKQFSLETVFWKGAIKPTPIGVLILEKV